MRPDRWRALVVRVVAALVAGAALAQAPVGPVFQVNTYTPGDQKRPVVAMRPDGGFVVVWESGPHPLDPDGSAIIGQRFNPAGSKVGGEFLVNSTTTGSQTYPSIAMNASGAFVVEWNRTPQTDCAVQRFDVNGSPIGSEVPSCVAPTILQANVVEMDAAGGWRVAYKRVVIESPRVFMQRFDSTGSQVGVETFCCGIAAGWGFQRLGGHSDRGEFVVTYPVDCGLDYSCTFVRRHAADGQPLGNPFRPGVTLVPDVDSGPGVQDASMDRHGDFYVAWLGVDASLYKTGPMLRIYSSSGFPRTPILPLATGSEWPLHLRLAGDDEGNHVAFWSIYGTSIYGQAFDRSGSLLGPRLQISRQPGANASYKAPDVASDRSRGFVVVWADYSTDGSGLGVFGQRFCQHGSTDGLRIAKSAGNGTLTATWTNIAGADDYVLYEDGVKSGGFATVTGTATQGTIGITTAMPPSNRFYLLSVRSAVCGEGTKR